MIDLVIARLKGQVSDFHNRVEGAAALSALIERQALPANTPAAHVIPAAMRGGTADAAAGAFLQEFTETVAVVITVRPNDRVGARGIEPIEALKTSVINALVGWAPSDELGVFTLTSGQITTVLGGAVAYTLQFRIADQLRIMT